MFFLVGCFSFLWFSFSLAGGDIRDVTKSHGLEVYNTKKKPAGIVKLSGKKLVFFDREAVTFKKRNSKEWGIYNVENKLEGKLVRRDNHILLYDKNGKYTKIIFYVKDRKPTRTKNKTKYENPELKDELDFVSTMIKHVKITPKTARLYCNVMKALK
jgi:hypothetical protein